MSFPATESNAALQDCTGLPSTRTMQAPHCSSPQPNRVPVRPSVLRRISSSGVSAAISSGNVRLWPFTEREGGGVIGSNSAAIGYPVKRCRLLAVGGNLQPSGRAAAALLRYARPGPGPATGWCPASRSIAGRPNAVGPSRVSRPGNLR